MKILLAHNYYQQPGGEDLVFSAEAGMLQSHGHAVVRYCYHNDEIVGMGALTLAAKTLWNREAHRDLRMMIRLERPDICHFHNTFPLMSPSVIHAAKQEGVPVVLTLHNYRLACPKAVFMRDGKICEDCSGKVFAWPAVAHACYRDSRPASLVTSLLLLEQRMLSKSFDQIDLFIALTEFSRQKFIQSGLPANRIVVKPNFVDPDPGFSDNRDNSMLFVGRLSSEKGIATLLNAWRRLGRRVPLRIIGDGPMSQDVRAAMAEVPDIQWLGQRSHFDVIEEMKTAYMLMFPSIWFEGFGLTLVEAYATGLPVIASNIGTMQHLVEDGEIGRHFEAGNADDLADKVRWCLDNPQAIAEMREKARKRFESNYTESANYRLLTRIYEQAKGSASAGTRTSERLKETVAVGG
jgi:glycosyltransferase involved in cell wall biosynthesis